MSEKKTLRLKGLAGSFDALLGAALFNADRRSDHLFIVHDKEEAAYFHDDLSNFLDENFVLFPSSYKKPYCYEEVENANILRRTEVLNKINAKQNLIITTFPEALAEKVINKRSLISNTFTVHSGESLDTEFLAGLLLSHEFEKTDLVYEPGQFAIRGGIVDVFSFADENPCRFELFGDKIESIKSFDPETQLSIRPLAQVSLVPDTQTRLLKEVRQSFMSFLPDNFVIWMKDYRQALDIVDKSFQKARGSFEAIHNQSGASSCITHPEQLFESRGSFSRELQRFTKVEFGQRSYLDPEEEIDCGIKPQPSFHKNFTLLAANFQELQQKNFTKYIAAGSYKQIDRLSTIFEEIDPGIQFTGLKASLKEGFIDDQEEIALYTDHQIFDRHHPYAKKEAFSKTKALTIKEMRSLQPGDFVVHADHGIGRFAGLDIIDAGPNKQEALRLVYRDDDLLYVSLHSLHKISKYSGKEGAPPAISKLGSGEWENKKRKVKKKVKDIARDLISLYAKRKSVRGYAFPEDDYLQAALESSFLYQDTPDQSLASSDVKADMEKESPMDRLVCGDVGFGKTEIAIRAAFKAVNAGKQVAVLVPTTILAMQHYHTFTSRLELLPVCVKYINRFKSAKETNEIKTGLKEGKIDILIGTHRIVNPDMEFKDLGLMIIDEEQKFGVKVKERLKNIRINIDVLTLTATPIPRTLHFSLMGARDLSIISTPPLNRRPVTTELHSFSEEVIRDAISHELRRNGQAFVVHNRVSEIEHMGSLILKLVPDARIGIAHGQMEGAVLEKVMLRFIEGNYDVLVSTNIIESGLDIPNANTIIINNAQMFGLSDLHQMRGRVGRSNTKAYCFMLTPPTLALTSDARKRLITLEEFSDLGDGFNVAMRDLDIRGAGNLLGAEQSGFINDIGFETYHKILDEAVQELKEQEFKELLETEFFKKESMYKKTPEDCTIETDFESLIPERYVSSIPERLSLYTKLDNLKDEKELADYEYLLRDRFGPIPAEVETLIKSVRLRWEAIKIGFEKVTVRNGKMRCCLYDKKPPEYFRSDRFEGILSFVKAFPERSRMKEVKNKLTLTIFGVKTIEDAINTITEMMFQPELAEN